MHRHNLATLRTLFAWYGAWSIVGVLTLFVGAGFIRVMAGPGGISGEQALYVVWLLGPPALAGLVMTWPRVAAKLQMQRTRGQHNREDGHNVVQGIHRFQRKRKHKSH